MTTPSYYQTVEEFVKVHDGTHVIEKVLIANNGISAVKAIRSIRRWAYDMFGRERAIKFVAMATPEDLKANAEYIRMADEFVEVPGGSNVNNYANVQLIIQLAKRYNVHAVFAGWGHASENPALPDGLLAENIVFMGPPSGPMFALGDKIGSTIIAQSAGVPVIPWSGDGLKCDYRATGKIEDEVYRAANITTVEECRAAVERVGLPVMIKASEGGGGKGIRKVTSDDQLDTAFRQVQNEVPGSPIFVMKVAFGARHLEVQLLADHYGNAVALNGRDCSIQRRHQKILEEGPPSAAPADVWRQMEKAAVRLAKEVGYRNAGTVEYLFTESEKTFCFLELNPRLQVEHPVTEMITGVNLPAAQLQVAMGIPLHRNKDIRRFFGKDPFGTEPIDFDNTESVPPEGHCIAARITAENPHKNFQPTSGKVQELNFRSSRHVWGYFSIDSSGLIHEFADSQLGHVFAWGPNREEARRNLVVALKDMSIRGEIRTTIEYLISLIEIPDYKANKFHTAWLDERIAMKDVRDSTMDPITVVLVGAACEAHMKATNRQNAFLASLERGQMPPQTLLSQKFNTEIIFENIKYVLDVAKAGLNLYSITLAATSSSSQPVIIEVRSLADGGYLVLMGGKSHVAYLKDEVGARRLVIDSQTCLFVDEYDPTTVRAAMGGKIVRSLFPDGTLVKKDQPFCEIEVMKMTMPLVVPEDGKVFMMKSAGSVMQPGDVIARLELADSSKVKRAEKFEGTLPVLGEPRPELSESNPHHVLANAKERLEDCMTGYAPPKSVRRAALNSLGLTSLNPFLFVLEVRETLSRVKRELPYQVQDTILKLCSEFEEQMLQLAVDSENKDMDSQKKPQIVASMSQVNLAQLAEEPTTPVSTPTMTRQESTWKRAKTLNDEQLAQAFKLAQEYASKAVDALKDVESPLIKEICARHARSAPAFALQLVENLLERYAAPEAAFAELEFSDSAEKDDVMQELRRKYSADAKKVYDFALSHSAVSMKNEIAVNLLGMVENAVRRQEELAQYFPGLPSIRSDAVALLKRVASLRGKETTDVALEARQLLIELQTSTYQERLGEIVDRLRKVSENDPDAIDALQHSTDPILHMLIDVLCNSSSSTSVKKAALASYVRRVYQTYKVRDLHVADANPNELGMEYATFLFYSEPDSVTFQVPNGLGLFGEGELLNSGLSEGEQLLLNQQSDGSKAGDATPPARPSAHVRTNSTSSIGAASANRPRAGSDQLGENDKEEMVDAGELNKYAVAPFIVRKACLSVFNGLNELKKNFKKLLQTVKIDKDQVVKVDDKDLPLKTDVQVLHIILNLNDAEDPSIVDVNPDSLSKTLQEFLQESHVDLKEAGIRRITFAVPSKSSQAKHHVVAGHGSSFFTFRRRSSWEEDRLVRHIEPSLAYQLDLKRLSNFNIARVPLGKRDLSASRTVHVYRATPKGDRNNNRSRLFVRALVRQTSKIDGVADADSYPGPERVLVQAMAAIEAVQGAGSTEGARNHIFLNVLGDALVEPYVVERMARHLGRRYASRLASARVGQVELKVNARFDQDSPSIPVRIIASNPTGFGLRVDTYVEAADPANPGRCVFYSISEGDDGGASGALAAMGLSSPSTSAGSFFNPDDGELEQHSLQTPELHGQDTQIPYPISSPLEERRSRALASGTAFCYDFPAIFHKALEKSWVSFANGRRGVDIPSISTMCTFEELVLIDEIDAPGQVAIPNTNLAKTTRLPGSNAIAMIAWKCHAKTPQYPEGRNFILISNDITIDAGSFGTREDLLFLEASKLARMLKIPRLYIAANSGARIGMADEVKRCFKVAWIDDAQPSKGFRYIYLDPDVYQLLGDEGKKSVICEKIEENAEVRYKITAIIGEGGDLGVENLRGSGLIAGETSRAYDETFTLTYVAGRSVGIGAYLVRLGQRTIQKGKDAPIILTGFQALNTLVGSPVYSSNLQLGGPGIMYANGVSHQCVRNDLEGVSAMLRWLSYVPEYRGATLPLTRLLREDSPDREVVYPKQDSDLTGDPRLLLAGVETSAEEGEWIPGLFDRGSFQEYLGGWAKTIITGRARLGGIPVGVIIPECRTVTTRIPADPAAPDSQERVVTQAGNVWYPDSSYKTASCIRDVNREGLPLIFIINIRGFSGGQRDMYDSVLKYGSMIVDALVDFKQPVIVYIPKKAELRGGAWVVVDPTINENVMEMWCDETARGGVLEASGAASIKFRVNDQLSAAHRLDPVLIDLDEQLSKSTSAETTKMLQDKIKAREKLLLPVYSQLATEFADAHDRPGRMVAKGVVNGVIPWSQCRQFFYKRLRRLLREFDLARKIIGDRQDLTLKAARAALKDIYHETGEALNHSWEEDAAIQLWMDSPDGASAVDVYLRSIRAASIEKQVEALGNQDAQAMLKGLMSLITRMSGEGRIAEREKLVSALRKGVFVLSSTTQQKPL